MVEDRGSAVLIAYAVPLDQASPDGDMLTVEEGHCDYWSELGRRGARALREAGIPTAPLWSEYEEWPRGRVLFNRTTRRFIIRADRQLHRPLCSANRRPISAVKRIADSPRSPY
jgi:hypothetical protein